MFSAQIFIFLSGILSGINVISEYKAAFKPSISRFFGGSIPSLGTIIKSLAFAGLFDFLVKKVGGYICHTKPKTISIFSASKSQF